MKKTNGTDLTSEDVIERPGLTIGSMRVVRREEQREAEVDTKTLLTRLHMDMEAFNRTIENVSSLVAIRAEQKLAQRRQVEATPTRLLPIPEVAAMLGRTPRAVEQMIARGQLRAVRAPGGRRRHIEYQEIQRYFERCRRETV